MRFFIMGIQVLRDLSIKLNHDLFTKLTNMSLKKYPIRTIEDLLEDLSRLNPELSVVYHSIWKKHSKLLSEAESTIDTLVLFTNLDSDIKLPSEPLILPPILPPSPELLNEIHSIKEEISSITQLLKRIQLLAQNQTQILNLIA